MPSCSSLACPSVFSSDGRTAELLSLRTDAFEKAVYSLLRPSASYLPSVELLVHLVDSPSSQLMRLRNVRLDRHCRVAEHRQRSSSEIADLDPLERNDRLVLVIERFCLLSPQCQANTLTGLVNECQVSLRELVVSVGLSRRAIPSQASVSPLM